MKHEIYEVRIRKTNTLNEAQQIDIQKQLNNVSGDFDYCGYTRISYVVAGTGLDDNGYPELKIVKIEPIEGTVIDEHERIMDLIDDSIF